GPEKLVPVLGTRGRLPVEVVRFSLPLVTRSLDRIGLAFAVRMSGAQPFVTDNGNVIVDCTVAPITAPAELPPRPRALPGVIDTGLFLGTAHMVLVADGAGVQELARPST